MAPRVTVILATYNWSEVLPFSIGSVLRQTFRDFELLVVGDGCTDDSEQVVAAIGDPRVRWINLPENTRHQSGPNNEGLRQARGEIIAYLGHDDLWLPHHLQSHVEALDASGAEMAFSLCLIVPRDDSVYWTTLPTPEREKFSPPSATTHRRALVEELGAWKHYRDIDEARDIAPDIELWRRVRRAGRKMATVKRLTAIKFPAGWRRDVYRTRPCDEQAHWLARIDAEPHLETELLINCLAGSGRTPTRVPYRTLLRDLFDETLLRVRGRLALPAFGFRRTRRGSIDAIRRFKGL